MQKYFRAEIIALVLIVLTFALSGLYEFGMNRTLILDRQNPLLHADFRDDRSEGGCSESILTITDSSWKLSYNLKPQAPFPFALIKLDLTQNGHGVDLSSYDEMQIWIQAQGPLSKRIRMHIRNSNPDYTIENDPISLKYNEVYFPPAGLNSPVLLQWPDFHVAGWWLAKKDIAFKHNRVDVSDVRWIDIVSPELLTDGSGSIEVKRIEFSGKWISSTVFFKMLLGLWMTVWTLFIAFSMWNLRNKLKQKETREKELIQINAALSIQTKELESKASHDELTGLLNRHGLRDRLFEALEQSKIRGMNISLIFVDIDHFKRINDTKGHPEGDRILQLIAKTIATNIRETDITSRWGGEEFLILCQGLQVDSARILAEKIRQIIQALPDDVTCSFGVSSIDNGSIQELIKKADKALYYAKEMGRNRVEVTV